ncbi:YqzH family protein [Metabacillus sp. Hm71]|uniref:YqzH family protein n=1 Tax=Metabacillus sp. Hm71 TaxID=3450743 RepID=UPI003F41C7C5
MEEKFLLKMLRNSFLQYGRDLDKDPLSKDDYIQLLEKAVNEKDQDTEWYEVIEDIVYGYVTNQD